jgi:hypothetical protein
MSEPSSGATSGTSVTWLSRIVDIMPVPTPATAVRIGRSIANTDPKARNRMTAAAAMPTSSAVPIGGSWVRATAWPPSSTASPSPSASSARSTRSSITALSTALACSVKVTWA